MISPDISDKYSNFPCDISDKYENSKSKGNIVIFVKKLRSYNVLKLGSDRSVDFLIRLGLNTHLTRKPV